MLQLAVALVGGLLQDTCRCGRKSVGEDIIKAYRYMCSVTGKLVGGTILVIQHELRHPQAGAQQQTPLGS